jgi:hypothetical protein
MDDREKSLQFTAYKNLAANQNFCGTKLIFSIYDYRRLEVRFKVKEKNFWIG